MTRAAFLLETYYGTIWDEEKTTSAGKLVALAASGDSDAMDALLYLLNDENDSTIRLQIVKVLRAARSVSAIGGLTKAMFDADGLVRAQAAAAIAEYDNAHLLAPSLSALLDALPDPTTRGPADRAIRTVTGRAPEKISVSERERVKLGEHPESIWPDYFASLPRAGD